jgi:hypothetical protein
VRELDARPGRLQRAAIFSVRIRRGDPLRRHEEEEVTMAKPTTALVSKSDVQRAKVELDRMRGSLKSWLKFRTLNDAVVAGVAPTKKPRKFAAEVITQSRDWDSEQKLAKQLYVLLSESLPGISLPDPNVVTNPQAAVQLAKIAIDGPSSSSPQAQGAWYTSWPVLIVGGLLLAITTTIRSVADVAKDREEKACIQAGACTDSGFWLKVGGVSMLVYIAWQMGLGERVKRMLKG